MAGGVNVYGYAGENPTDLVDPLGLSAINILVIPSSKTALTTKGTLVVQVNGVTEFQGLSLEPSGTSPVTGNELPPGVYPATVWPSPELHYPVLRLSDDSTFPMVGVEIHIGNGVHPNGHSDTLGCILPGTAQDPKNPDWVINSGQAFNQIMNIVNNTKASDAANGESTTITVTQF